MSYSYTEPVVNVGTFVELTRWRALSQSDDEAFTFLLDGAEQTQRWSYADVDRRARVIAAALQRQRAANERVLLLYPPGLEYIGAFLGCLYAGAVAVPVYPPRLNQSQARLQAILTDARAQFALTVSSIHQYVARWAELEPGLGALQWMATDTLINASLADDWHAPRLTADTLAFIQYTSGSTGRPKGVMLTHRNLFANSALIHAAFGHTPTSRGVIWLPPYHDMGLIGGILQPLYGGFPVTLMSPFAFLQQPLRWLQAISDYRATTSGGPNFAFDLCVRKITPEQRAALDLSRWDLAFTGAEPIRAETLERFAAAFAPSGFRREAFYPCYGLAEATLIVSGGNQAQQPTVRSVEKAALEQNMVIEAAPDTPQAMTLVGCGQPLGQQTIAIVNPETALRHQPGEVGEIWVRGSSIAQGYWQRDEETQRVFGNVLDGQGPFLRTGDLGFLDNDQLFVTGRLKDLIIIRGRNHYPQDIERTVEQSHTALRPGCGAAFTIDEAGEERLVIVQEIERQHRHADTIPIIGAIRQAIAEQHGIQVHAIALLRPASIFKTSSGKIQRQACRAAFVEGTLPVIGMWREALEAPLHPAADNSDLSLDTSEAIAAWLSSWVAAALDVDVIDPAKPLTWYGLDSLRAIELTYSCSRALDVEIPLAALLEAPSISALAQQLRELRSDHGRGLPAIAPQPEQGPQHPLSGGQRALWFLHLLDPVSTAYHIPAALRLQGRLDRSALQRAVDELVARHAALRTTFTMPHDEPIQQVHERTQVPVADVNAAAWPEDTLSRRLGALVDQPLDLEHGPLLRVQLCARTPDDQILLLTLHHIIADGWSVVVLVQELWEIYQQYLPGGDRSQAALEPIAIHYSDFVRWQQQSLTSAVIAAQIAYWRHQLDHLPVLKLPLDAPRPPRQTFRGARRYLRLSREQTRQLKTLSREEQATLFMVVLAAFQVVLHSITGQTELVVGTDAANRPQAELMRTIGLFTNQLVLRTSLAGDPSLHTILHRARQTVLAAHAHQSVPFQHLVSELQLERDLSRNPLFDIMFTFRNIDLPTPQVEGLTLAPIEVDAATAKFDLTVALTDAGDVLHGSFEYNTALFETRSIARLIYLFEVMLSNFAQHLHTSLSGLDAMLAEAERNHRHMEQKKREQSGPGMFKKIQPKPVSIAARQLVSEEYTQPGATLPLVIRPEASGVDLADWATGQRDRIMEQLYQHGAILFQGFNYDTVPQFERFALTVCGELFTENGEHTPISSNGNVQTPVFYPADKQLLWHNENSFNHTWPLNIIFGCAQPAEQGGETPLVDSRKVLERLDPTIRDAFTRKQVLYRRNYGQGLGLSWQTVFRTESRAEVEAQCRRDSIMFEWKDGDRLTTWQVRPAVIAHPKTGELSWFNQAQHWHIACLDPETRAALLETFREEDLPRHCYFGDGSPIPDAMMEAILAAYRELEVSNPWRKGDIMLVDNVLVAHGRNPYVGPRKIMVALAQMTSFADIE